MQHNLWGLTMSSVGVTIAFFCPKHDIVAPKTTARMLGNLRFLGYEIVQFGILKQHRHRGSPGRASHPIILVPNDPWYPRLAHTELAGG